MTQSEATDYIQFNVIGAYVGNNTPVFIMRWKKFQKKN
jgi:hypothetical protein